MTFENNYRKFDCKYKIEILEKNFATYNTEYKILIMKKLLSTWPEVVKKEIQINEYDGGASASFQDETVA